MKTVTNNTITDTKIAQIFSPISKDFSLHFLSQH